MGSALRVLITIQTMEGPAGGSLYVRDFALELFRQGHQPTVYCRRLGSISTQLLQLGIPVIDCIDNLGHPDIIHGNSPIETVAAILRFPGAPAVFVSHGWGSPDAIPPKLPSIVRYLAVSEHARDALLCFHGIPGHLIHMHQNPVDLERFPRRGALPAKPHRALVLSNSLTEANYLSAIENACSAAGLSMDVVGLGMGTARSDPERILADYDIVFAKGRSALEALATGCAVILCDASGFGELITTENYEVLRLRNFGIRTLHLPPDAATVLTQIRRYDPNDAAAVSDRVRSREGLSLATATLVEHYLAAIADFRDSFTSDWNSERIAAARFLDTIAPTSNTFFVAQQLEPLQQRARSIEAKFRRLGETLSMEPLSEAELRRIQVHLVTAPHAIDAGGTYQAVVRVINQSGRVLSGLGENPISLSYHWLNEDHSVVCFDGVRSEFYPPLPPGVSFEYPVQFRAPAGPGKYILRLTLVQEYITWLDPLGVYCETTYVVTPAASAAGV